MAETSRQGEGTLGTFAGVFTPSILTILGIILFLRMGYVVGEAGLLRALLIIVIANAISVLTSISLSAIATNLRVKGGGDYYLISRTLGVEFGGALGLVLFLAQSVSIAFYAIGFGEATSAILRRLELPTPGTQWIAAIAVALLFVLAWLGSDWASRFQFVVMGILAASLVAFFVGGFGAFSEDTLRDNLAPGGSTPFWLVFAIFFPAVTGFTQGVSLSGDLIDPGKSLPRGTFAAVGLSFAVYLTVAVVFAGAAPSVELVLDPATMGRIARFGWLIDAGVVSATLSSALASFLGAPRILQRLASDRVFPVLSPFAVGHGPTSNPRRGVLLAAGISFATIAAGDLNFVAPVVSMFFLISYGLLNYATYVEARAGSPSFRPRFRFFDHRLSLLGGLGCLGAMIAIHPPAALVAALVLLGVFYWVRATVSVERWADSNRSRMFQRVRRGLLGILAEPEHPRYWRPVILAFSDEPQRREMLLRFSSWIEGGSGLTTLIRIVTGTDRQTRIRCAEIQKEMGADIKRLKVDAFPRAIAARSSEDAIPILLQGYGLGPLRANTVLVDWPDDSANALELIKLGAQLRPALRNDCNVVVLHAAPEDFERISATRRSRRRIDVWHRDNATGRLMLLLAYLMTRQGDWHDARLRLWVPRRPAEDPADRLAGIHRLLDEIRIPAEAELVDTLDPTTFAARSEDASVTFLPFRMTEKTPTGVDGESIEGYLEPPGLVAFTLARQDLELDAEPERGPGEAASALDAARTARAAADKAARASAKASAAAVRAEEQLERARGKTRAEERVPALEEQARLSREGAEKAKRKAAKAQAKAHDAERAAREVSGDGPDPE